MKEELGLVVRGRRERPALFADVGQGCGVVGKHPDHATHQRIAEMEKANASGPELTEVDGVAPLHDRPAA